MKVVYHPRYAEVYSSDPAAKAGRMESALREVSPLFELVTPGPAAVEDLTLVHSPRHVEDVRRMGLTYDIALLAAGGA
ncbi:MAG: histone deacetylase family protein, partial [Chloroflexi bacterium]